MAVSVGMGVITFCLIALNVIVWHESDPIVLQELIEVQLPFVPIFENFARYVLTPLLCISTTISLLVMFSESIEPESRDNQ